MNKRKDKFFEKNNFVLHFYSEDIKIGIQDIFFLYLKYHALCIGYDPNQGLNGVHVNGSSDKLRNWNVYETDDEKSVCQ